MEHWEKEKKWLMIHQDHQAELLASGVPQNQLEYAATKRASIEVDRLPNSYMADSSTITSLSPTRQSPGGPLLEKSTSTPIHHVHITSANNSSSTVNSSNNKSVYPIHTVLRKSRSIANLSSTKTKNSNSDHSFEAHATDHNSPEYFVRKFLDPNLRSVTPKIAASLEVSLRTRSIE